MYIGKEKKPLKTWDKLDKHLGLIKLFLNQQFRRHRLLPIFRNWCNFLDVCEGDVPSWIVGKNYFRRGSTEKKIFRSYYTELY